MWEVLGHVFQNIQTDTGIHTAPYPGVIWKNLPQSKAAGQ